jgi:hypothetical protein
LVAYPDVRAGRAKVVSKGVAGKGRERRALRVSFKKSVPNERFEIRNDDDMPESVECDLARRWGRSAPVATRWTVNRILHGCNHFSDRSTRLPETDRRDTLAGEDAAMAKRFDRESGCAEIVA